MREEVDFEGAPSVLSSFKESFQKILSSPLMIATPPTGHPLHKSYLVPKDTFWVLEKGKGKLQAALLGVVIPPATRWHPRPGTANTLLSLTDRQEAAPQFIPVHLFHFENQCMFAIHNRCIRFGVYIID